MEATTKDLRLHTRTLIAATDRGEEVIITYRGKPRARLMPLGGANEVRESEPVPYRDTSGEAASNPLFGLWRDQDESVDDYVRRLRQSREF